MSDSVTRLRRGASVLATIFIIAILGYRYGAGYGWIESIWMVVITISSVGFSEASSKDANFQLFTIAVIVIGMSALAYTFSGFVQMLLEGEIEQALGNSRMKRKISQLRNHVIVCGYGRMGEALCESLERKGLPFVVIEKDVIAPEEMLGLEHLHLVGDATEEHVLLEAGLERAHSIVTSIPNDAANVFITLTARDINPNILIVSRAEHSTTEKKLRQAGADRVVMPILVGAHQMARSITKPSTADLLNLVSDAKLDIDLDELIVTENSQLVGIDVRSSEAHRTYNLLVVAIKQADGEMIFNPSAEHVFHVNDTLLVMGNAKNVDSFRRHYGLMDG